MSQSMAKRIRKFAEVNKFIKKDEPKEYKVKEHKKTVSFIDHKGMPQMVPVTKKQFICKQRQILTAIKTHVEAGRIQLPSLKELHAQAAQMKEAK